MGTTDSVSLAQPLEADVLCRAVPQDTVDEALFRYGGVGPAEGDSVLCSEQPHKPYGFAGEATPFRIRHDGWSGILLLVCLLFAANLVVRLRKKFWDLLRGVFFPIPGKADEPLVDDPLRYSTRLVAVCLLSLSASMVTFSFTQRDVGYYPFPETPYLLFGVFCLLWLTYFVVKRMLISFVEWVFFRKEKIFTMARVQTFLYVVESLLLLVFSLVVEYLRVPYETVPMIALGIVVLTKACLLFKTYQIFFPKMYGTLHLFVYFCTLEIMPLLVMPQILEYTAVLSTIKL